MKQIRAIKKRLHGKWKLALLLTALLLLAAVGITLAAIIGRGTRKGVLTGTIGYFNSDLLYNWDNVEIYSPPSSVNIRGTTSISIRNYNIATGETNGFKVDYDIYAWIEGGLEEGFTYQIEHDGSTHNITATTYGDAAANKISETLPADEQRTDTYTISFVTDSAEISNATIVVAAVPTSPDFMRSKRKIGGFRHRPDAYAVSGSFDYLPTSTVDGYAAFIYRPVSYGTPDDGQLVRITWQQDKLTLDSNTDYLEYIENNSLNIPASVIDAGMSLTFFRNTTENTYWTDTQFSDPGQKATGWSTLNGLVTVQLVIGTEE